MRCECDYILLRLKMCNLLKRLFLIVLLTKVSFSEKLCFENENEYYEFYENWLKLTDPEDFREKLQQYMTQIMNKTVDPCDDFYKFACGNFRSVVPRNHTWTFVGPPRLLRFAQKNLQSKLLADNGVENQSEASSKLRTFHQSCLNANHSRAAKLEEMKKFVVNFANWPILDDKDYRNDFDWLNVTAQAARYEVSVMFFPSVVSQNNFMYARLTYDHSTSYKIDDIKKTARNLSINLDGKESDLLMVKEFADKVQELKEKPEEVEWTYYTFDDLEELVPQINFHRFFQIMRNTANVSTSEKLLVYRPTYFKDLGELVSQTDSKVIANYVFSRLLEFAYIVIEERDNEDLERYCNRRTSNLMIAAMMGLYVEQYYDDDSHGEAVDTIDAIYESAREVIEESDWFTNDTRMKAFAKLDAIKRNVGVPDNIRLLPLRNQMYENIHVNQTNFYQSFLDILRVEAQMKRRKAGQPDYSFLKDPMSVYAVYKRSENVTLEVSASMLQPPYFHKFAPKFVNFGGIGWIAAHELMHAFDGEGFKFDEQGAFSEILDESVNLTYTSRAECYKSQYSSYRVSSINGTADGESTISENIADNEGARVSMKAYQRWLENNTESTNIFYKQEELSPMQSFFLAFAQSHCDVFTENETKKALNYDTHSPAFMRVIGVVTNLKEFAEAYNCPIGSNMNPEKKCTYL